MKFSISFDINRPPEDVWVLMTDNDEVMKWLPELVAYQHLSGTKGEVGSSTRLSYEVGKTKFDALMKIVALDFPYSRTTYLAAKNYLAISAEELKQKSNGTTRYTSAIEYNFESPFMKLFSPILKPLYKLICLKKFKLMKVFAEAQAAQFR